MITYFLQDDQIEKNYKVNILIPNFFYLIFYFRLG